MFRNSRERSFKKVTNSRGRWFEKAAISRGRSFVEVAELPGETVRKGHELPLGIARTPGRDPYIEEVVSFIPFLRVYIWARAF